MRRNDPWRIKESFFVFVLLFFLYLRLHILLKFFRQESLTKINVKDAKYDFYNYSREDFKFNDSVTTIESFLTCGLEIKEKSHNKNYY